MRLYERMLDKEEELAVVGLGYVGLPLAVEFSNYFKVIGFDTNSEKINLYKKGYDPTKDVGKEKIKKSSVNFTSMISMVLYCNIAFPPWFLMMYRVIIS